MAIKNLEDIYRDIGNKIYSPIYLLQGEEPYYIDYLSDLIERSVLDEFEKEFNQTVVYGRDSEPLSLVSNLKRYPMMANYQVVILKEAQDMRAGLAAKAAEEKKAREDALKREKAMKAEEERIERLKLKAEKEQARLEKEKLLAAEKEKEKERQNKFPGFEK